MAAWFSRFFANIRALGLSLLVHVLLFALMGFSLTWNRTIKPSATQPIQAQVINVPKEVEEIIKPEPVPEPKPPKLIPIPKPVSKPKPIQTVYSYPCAGKQLEADTEEKAKALQAKCEQEELKKEELAEQERKEKVRKQKKLEEKKLKEALAAKKKREEEQKEKELVEKKRKEEEQKEKELAEKKLKEEEQKEKELAEKKLKEKEQKEKEVAEKKRQQQAADAKRKQEADERARQAVLARAAAARVEGEAVTAFGLAKGRIAAAIDSNWIQPQSSTLGLEAIIRVNVSPGGAVMSARVVKSSGNALFDRSAEIAVQKASPLPIPNDPRYYPYIKEFDFRFKPNG